MQSNSIEKKLRELAQDNKDLLNKFQKLDYVALIPHVNVIEILESFERALNNILKDIDGN